MKVKIIIALALLMAVLPWFYSTAEKKSVVHAPEFATPPVGEQPCVFMTIMGEQSSEGFSAEKLNKKAKETILNGEKWLVQAQNKDGGWGAGSHSNQREMNPHKVPSDPATTAMSAMALYRVGHSINSGPYQKTLREALNFILKEIQDNRNDQYITKVRGTQIQSKLGQHIDAIMSLQFLNQIYPTLTEQALKDEVQQAIQICVNKVEQSIDNNGKVGGSGWAGVLQSSFAGAGLEMAAKNAGIQVDTVKLQKARDYQKSNYNPSNENVKTSDGAGIMLYSVSSSVRNSAEESREAEKAMKKAKAEGKIDKDAEINEKNLIEIGVAPETAKTYDVAYKVYQSAKVKAMKDEVMNGFGSNGGEEFMSFLQTGESMMVNQDDTWMKWYDNVSGRLMKIQNNDGSWHGHHCITSPVFCTATCLLILTIENDMALLQQDFKD